MERLKTDREYAKDNGFELINTGIDKLPAKDSSVDYVFALDVLEHVDPDLRLIGYREINRVLKDRGFLIINNPAPGTISHHNSHYEWGFDLGNLTQLTITGDLELLKLEVYGLRVKTTKGEDLRKYEWIVLQKS